MHYLIIILIIGLIVLFHEFGHFICARMANIPVATFSIGFGPKLLRWKRRETEFCISIIPIGGYILPAVNDEKEFYKISPNRRILFAIGGPVANILSSVIIFFMIVAVKSGFSADLLTKPFAMTFGYLMNIITALPLMFDSPEKLSGIVGIISAGGQMISSKLQNSLTLFALLSLNLAVFNLIPIPALDGGKIILYLLEKIHPKLLRIQLPLTVAGWLLIFGLMIYATVNDVAKLLA